MALCSTSQSGFQKTDKTQINNVLKNFGSTKKGNTLLYFQKYAENIFMKRYRKIFDTLIWILCTRIRILQLNV